MFKNLADIKEIEAWSFDSVELTEGQKRFMEFWDRLPDYYTRLNKKMSDETIKTNQPELQRNPQRL